MGREGIGRILEMGAAIGGSWSDTEGVLVVHRQGGLPGFWVLDWLLVKQGSSARIVGHSVSY